MDRVRAVALGNSPADILLKNGRVVDVLTETIYEADVAIAEGMIAGVGRKKKKKKIQDAYTLLYMCASWIFACLPQIDSLPTERRPCDFFLFYLSLLIII